MVDLKIFWSYVNMWVSVNHCSWDTLAEEVGISRSTLYRLRNGVGGSELTLKQFNDICQGIGLIPEMCITHNSHYGEPMVFHVKD